MKLSILARSWVVIPFALLVSLAVGIGFGYYKHSDVSDRQRHKEQRLINEGMGTLAHDGVCLEVHATDNLLDIRRISVKRFSAWDSSGTQCPWKSVLYGNSEIGPGLCIEIDSHLAKDVLAASGELRYKGKMYSIEAHWQEKPTAWFPPGAMEWHQVDCTTQPSLTSPD
jgi:hypothetical protein